MTAVALNTWSWFVGIVSALRLRIFGDVAALLRAGLGSILVGLRKDALVSRVYGGHPLVEVIILQIRIALDCGTIPVGVALNSVRSGLGTLHISDVCHLSRVVVLLGHQVLRESLLQFSGLLNCQFASIRSRIYLAGSHI